MNSLRCVAAAVMLVAVVAIACSDLDSPTDVTYAASIMQDETCAEWSCSESVCGHPTWPPYHACCVRSIYDPPSCSYQEPCIEAQEPLCGPCIGCEWEDNYCWWGGNTCHFEEGFQCPGCCDEQAVCKDDPITESTCLNRDQQLHNYDYPDSDPGEYCSVHPLECADWCADGL